MTEKVVIGGDLSLRSVIDGGVILTHLIDGDGEKFMPKYPKGYEGEYSITPSEDEQVIPMAGLMASQNVKVTAIPKNYGRIEYNGSTITVY